MFSEKFFKAVGLSFARAFLAVFAVGAFNVYEVFTGSGSFDVAAGKAALFALIAASAAAGIKALQALFTNLDPADAEINPPADEKLAV